MLDPGEVGAAPLLGIDGLVFVGHGRSDARALVSAIRTVRLAVESDLLAALRSAIEDRLEAMQALIGETGEQNNQQAEELSS
jgi:glycerol-3-phosphate acyltransferase PlsX